MNQLLHQLRLFLLGLFRGNYVLFTLYVARGHLCTSSRLVIPIKKISLEEEAANKPIPTLSEKQFVVATSSLSEIEEKVQRELFWYREELFKCVSAHWHEVSIGLDLLSIRASHVPYETGGTRSGELSFRAQRMTLPMLETLRLEIARISLYLEPCDDDFLGEIGYAGARQYSKANEFVQLKAKVTNLSCNILPFPSAMHMLTTGYLSITSCVHTRF